MKKRKILVVDDEVNIRRLVQANLEKSARLPMARYQYELSEASDGQAGLEKIRAFHPDIVVLDVIMPKMDGFTVLEAIKKDPETRNIAVIMLTAKAQDADVFRGWQSGVDSYLTKPFNPWELVIVVERILDAMEEKDSDLIDIT